VVAELRSVDCEAGGGEVDPRRRRRSGRGRSGTADVDLREWPPVGDGELPLGFPKSVTRVCRKKTGPAMISIYPFTFSQFAPFFGRLKNLPMLADYQRAFFRREGPRGVID
jgi:hypothetical protein